MLVHYHCHFHCLLEILKEFHRWNCRKFYEYLILFTNKCFPTNTKTFAYFAIVRKTNNSSWFVNIFCTTTFWTKSSFVIEGNRTMNRAGPKTFLMFAPFITSSFLLHLAFAQLKQELKIFTCCYFRIHLIKLRTVL